MSIKSKILNKLKYYKSIKEVDILIWDDIFPHPVSGFRYEEFKCILKEFRGSKIIVNPRSYKIIGNNIADHKTHIIDFYKKNPDLDGKINKYQHLNNINAKLFYCVFLNNICSNLDWLENHKIPFVFTLYPGGGFQVNSKPIDKKLSRVFNSPMFRKVIVTQKFTMDYLINKGFCNLEQIKLIFGCVVPQNSINKSLANKPFYKKGKETFDIVFCAAKYTKLGEDKGYDTFIDFAKKISKKYEFIRFHVIGGFNKSVINVSDIEDKIHFYGYVKFVELAGIFKTMDVIISPNKPFILQNGSFDGFPLGTVVEATLNGVVPMVSDTLNENICFKDGEEIIIIENTSLSIEEKIEKLINDTDYLFSVVQNSKRKFSDIYNNNFQVSKRLEILKNEI